MKVRNLFRKLFFALIIVLCLLGLSCFALTPFSFQFLNSDGSTNFGTNILSSYPIANNVTVWNGVIVITKPLSLIPSANGIGTNYAEPGSYRLTVTSTGGQSIQAFVTIPDTTNLFPLASYIVGSPSIYTASSFYAFLTNALGGEPGIVQALGFQPMTNTVAGVTNVFTLTSLTNLLGLNALTNLLGLNAATNLLGLNGVTNLVGLNGATNLLGLNAATNLLGLNGVTNLIGINGATNLVGLNGVTNLMGTANATNLTGVAIPAGFTGTISNAAAGIVYRVNITNGVIVSTNTP